jgi:hypothetical protein
MRNDVTARSPHFYRGWRGRRRQGFSAETGKPTRHGAEPGEKGRASAAAYVASPRGDGNRMASVWSAAGQVSQLSGDWCIRKRWARAGNHPRQGGDEVASGGGYVPRGLSICPCSSAVRPADLGRKGGWVLLGRVVAWAGPRAVFLGKVHGARWWSGLEPFLRKRITSILQ